MKKSALLFYVILFSCAPHIIKLNTYEPPLSIYSGLENAAKGRYEEAKKIFEDYLDEPVYNIDAKIFTQLCNDIINETLSEDAGQDIFKCLYESGYRKPNSQYIFYLDRAAALQPDYSLTFVIYGKMHLQYDRFEKALIKLNKAAEINPDNMFAHYYLGRAHREMEMYSEALDDFGKAMFIDNQAAENYIERYEIYYKLKNYLLALINIHGAAKINTVYIKDVRYGEQLNDIGIYCMKTNDKTNALLAFQLSTLAGFRGIEPFLNRGLIYRQLKKYDLALTEYNYAAKIDSSIINTYYQRAVTYIEMNKVKEAERDLKKVLLLDRKNKKAVFKLAKLYYDSENDEKAAEYFQKTAELDKNDVWPYYWLGFLYDRNEKYGTALKNYYTFLNLVPDEYKEHKQSVQKRINWINKQKYKLK